MPSHLFLRIVVCNMHIISNCTSNNISIIKICHTFMSMEGMILSIIPKLCSWIDWLYLITNLSRWMIDNFFRIVIHPLLIGHLAHMPNFVSNNSFSCHLIISLLCTSTIYKFWRHIMANYKTRQQTYVDFNIS